MEIFGLLKTVRAALKDNNITKDEAQKIALAIIEIVYGDE
jgi:anti-sigma regulatory factor (Ser/Thr protein kinase)